MKCPTTPQEWIHVGEQLSKRWNLHHTIGAIDGKHIALKCPSKSGSVYYNYKSFYSIVLLAMLGAGYKFLFVYVGANGSCSDSGLFLESE